MAKTDRTAEQIEKDIIDDLKRAAGMARSRLLQPTAKWDHKPTFTTKTYMRGDDLVCDVSTDDAPYFFVDGGTAVRWAVMTNPFEPKTKVRDFTSYDGVGGLAYVMKKRKGMVGLPGIIAREWSKLTALEMSPVLQSMLNQTLANYTPKLTASGRAIHQSDFKP